MKIIYAILGGSGVGKSKLGNYLKTINIQELVSHTTRNIRLGEINGETYHYVTKEIFDKTEKVEYAEYASNYYCLSKHEIEDKLSKYDKVFVIMELKGIIQLKKLYDNVKVIYITAPIEELEKRMVIRGDKRIDIDKRLKNIAETGELNNGKYADYIIVNIDLDASKKQIKRIVEVS